MAVAFSPDGKSLATGSEDKTARLVAMADRPRASPASPTTARSWRWRSARTASPSPPGAGTGRRKGRGAHRGGGGRPRARPHHPRRRGRWRWRSARTASPRHRERVRTRRRGCRGGGGRPRARPHHPRRRGHRGGVQPGRQALATASWDKTARLVAVADGRERARITHDDAVDAVAFSPDGKTLATASGTSTARLWERWRTAASAPASPTTAGPGGGVQPGRPDPRHRELGQDGAARGGGGRPRARPHHPRRPRSRRWRSARTARPSPPRS